MMIFTSTYLSALKERILTSLRKKLNPAHFRQILGIQFFMFAIRTDQGLASFEKNKDLFKSIPAK